MNKNIGIILKKYYPLKKTIIVLDRTIGKIKCVPKTESAPTGSLISYYIAGTKPLYFINSLEIITLPFETARSDILFLHHILELCYYFSPLEASDPKVFDLIAFLYFFSYRIKYNIDKKMFLFKLFMLFGVYPEQRHLQKINFHRLAAESIDTIIDNNLHLGMDKELDVWLYACVKLHPCFDCFKTINFLKKNRLS